MYYFPLKYRIFLVKNYSSNKGNLKVALFNSKVSPREKMVYQRKIKSILELTNRMWTCVITAAYSIAVVVFSDRNNSSPQHKTMPVTQFHSLWCIQTSGKVQHLWCWSFVIVKHYDGFSIKLKRVQEPKGYFESTEQARRALHVIHSLTQCHLFSLQVTLNK